MMELSYSYQRPRLKDFCCSKAAKCVTAFILIFVVVLSYFQFCLKNSPEQNYGSLLTSKSKHDRTNSGKHQLFLNSGDRESENQYSYNNGVDEPHDPSAILGYKSQKCQKGITFNSRKSYFTFDKSAREYFATHGMRNNDATMNRNESGQQQLPKAIVIGFAKCGTSALVTFLELNSAFKTAKREIHFFDKDENYREGYEAYRQQMPFAEKDQIVVEKTPSYAMVESVPERMKIMNSSLKLIVTVKEPVTRAVSEYSKHYDDGKTNPDKVFEDYAINEEGEVNISYKPIKRSLYYLQIQKFFCYFPRKQIHVVDGENLIKNPVQELNKLENFLGVPQEITEDMVLFNRTKGFYCLKPKNKPLRCLPPKKGRKHPVISKEDMQILKDFYKPWNERFFKLIGQRFDW